DLHRFRMRIEHSWRERADNVAAHLKGLMNRRRLMHRAGDRLEILGVKSKWIEIAIPADRIERMMRMHNSSEPRPILHQDFDVYLRIDREHFTRRMEIAFGIRRPHSNLSFVIQVALR